MFTWICPKCGRDVPPSESECPVCTGKMTLQAEPPALPSQTEAPPQSGAAVPQAPAAAPPQHAAAAAYAPSPVPYPAPAPSRGMPGWLVTIIVAAVLVGGGAGAYFYLLPSSRGESGTAAAPDRGIVMQSPQVAGAKPHRLAKFVELVGIRITEDAKQKLQIRLIVVNHSAAELGDMKMNVALRPVTGKADAPPVSEFPITVPSLGPYESKEVTATIATKLRAYELPDWQFLRPEFIITTP